MIIHAAAVRDTDRMVGADEVWRPAVVSPWWFSLPQSTPAEWTGHVECEHERLLLPSASH
jgi:hypothetical protein